MFLSVEIQQTFCPKLPNNVKQLWEEFIRIKPRIKRLTSLFKYCANIPLLFNILYATADYCHWREKERMRPIEAQFALSGWEGPKMEAGRWSSTFLDRELWACFHKNEFIFLVFCVLQKKLIRPEISSTLCRRLLVPRGLLFASSRLLWSIVLECKSNVRQLHGLNADLAEIPTHERPG